MMDLDWYEIKLGANSIGESFRNDTFDIINLNFDSNPAYKTCIYEGEIVDCLYKLHKYDSSVVYLTFRPEFEVSMGDYVEFEDEKYIVKEITKNELYPKAEILLCANTLRWKDEETGEFYDYECSLSGNPLVLDDAKYSNNNRLVLRADSTIYAIIQYNEITKTIKPTQRFIINSNVYDVTSINDLNIRKGKGFLVLGLTSTSKSTSDDIEERVADETGNSGWGGW